MQTSFSPTSFAFSPMFTWKNSDVFVSTTFISVSIIVALTYPAETSGLKSCGEILFMTYIAIVLKTISYEITIFGKTYSRGFIIMNIKLFIPSFDLPSFLYLFDLHILAGCLNPFGLDKSMVLNKHYINFLSFSTSASMLHESTTKRKCITKAWNVILLCFETFILDNNKQLSPCRYMFVLHPILSHSNFSTSFSIIFNRRFPNLSRIRCLFSKC